MRVPSCLAPVARLVGMPGGPAHIRGGTHSLRALCVKGGCEGEDARPRAEAGASGVREVLATVAEN
jgi:hypothetical protein